MERLWFVASGPDSRHLHDVSVHKLAREARNAYKASQARAKQFFSMDFAQWEVGKNKRVIKQEVY